MYDSAAASDRVREITCCVWIGWGNVCCAASLHKGNDENASPLSPRWNISCLFSWKDEFGRSFDSKILEDGRPQFGTKIRESVILFTNRKSTKLSRSHFLCIGDFFRGKRGERRVTEAAKIRRKGERGGKKRGLTSYSMSLLSLQYRKQVPISRKTYFEKCILLYFSPPLPPSPEGPISLFRNLSPSPAFLWGKRRVVGGGIYIPVRL